MFVGQWPALQLTLHQYSIPGWFSHSLIPLQSSISSLLSCSSDSSDSEVSVVVLVEVNASVCSVAKVEVFRVVDEKSVSELWKNLWKVMNHIINKTIEIPWIYYGNVRTCPESLLGSATLASNSIIINSPTVSGCISPLNKKSVALPVMKLLGVDYLENALTASHAIWKFDIRCIVFISFLWQIENVSHFRINLQDIAEKRNIMKIKKSVKLTLTRQNRPVPDLHQSCHWGKSGIGSIPDGER